MVEDLLIPSPSTTTHYSYFQHQHGLGYAHGCGHPAFAGTSKMSAGEYDDAPLSPNTSLFASTDPFFIAQVQQAAAPPSSFFAQVGRPSQHSPFVAASASSAPSAGAPSKNSFGHGHGHGHAYAYHGGMSMAADVGVDSHAMLVASTGF